MKSSALKYYSFFLFILLSKVFFAQQDNQSVVTIIGDPIGNDNGSGNNFNPYQQQANMPPPQNQELIQTNMLIEPSLDNGFHMRFEVGVDQTEVNSFSSKPSLSSSSSSGGVSVKVKKRQPSLNERSFNLKKRLKSWLPKRKKRYRPNLCGRF